MTTLQSRANVLEETLKHFYNNQEHLKIFESVVERREKITLRRLERFITQDAKKLRIVMIKKNGNPFRIYNEYRSQQNAFTKRFFDPFCRYDRIFIERKDKKCIETTVGQLNFFRWIINNNILEYAINCLHNKTNAKPKKITFILSFD